MLYQIRMRLRDSTSLTDLTDINKNIDENVVPAIEGISGVNGCRAYSSIHGDVVWVIDMDNISVVDTILTTPNIGAAMRTVDKWLIRSSGGDVLYDRGSYQSLYAGN